MTKTTTIRRIGALQRRPLALCLGALCATSAAGAALAAAAPERPDARVPALLHEYGLATGAELAAGDPSHRPADVPVTNCNDSGPGSLRDAVATAASGDTVDLTQLSCSTISLTTGGIIFGQSQLALQGPGSTALTIDAGASPGTSALYHIGSGTVIVSDLSIVNGTKYRSDVTPRGGCIHSEGNVALFRTRVANCNTRSISNIGALGGAIFTQGQTYLRNSVVSDSRTHATGNGYASGGGIYSLGGLASLYSTISNNVALGDSATPSFGGGAFARGGVFILGSTVSGNHALRMGGLALADNAGQLSTIINSTISGNSANRIGGVFARAALNLYNSTIAFNTSTEWDDGSGHFNGAGVHVTVSGAMESSIIANNVNSGAPFATADLTGDTGAGFSGGHNNVMFCGTACPTDTTHEDPGLHPLQDNGGLTRTHVPTPGVWDTFGGTNPISLAWDQRGPGFPRQSVGDWPEIGALQINSDILFANGFN